MSMRSDASMDQPINFKSGDTQPDLRYNISIKILLWQFIVSEWCS